MTGNFGLYLFGNSYRLYFYVSAKSVPGHHKVVSGLSHCPGRWTWSADRADVSRHQDKRLLKTPIPLIDWLYSV